jgi:hypothetical protein
MLLRDYIDSKFPRTTVGKLMSRVILHTTTIEYLEGKITRGELAEHLVKLGYDNFQAIDFINGLDKRDIKIEQTPGGV